MTGWIEQLPEEVRSAIPEEHLNANMVTEAPDLGTFIKNALDNQAHIGRSITIPGDDSSDEAHAAFYEKLTTKVPALIPIPGDDATEAVVKAYQAKIGIPETPDGYELPELPEGVEMSDEMEKSIREWAREAGVPNKALKTFMEKWNENKHVEFQNLNTRQSEGLQALEAELGAAYKGKLDAASKIRDQFFPQLKDVDIRNMEVDTIKSMITLADAMGGSSNEFSKQDPNNPQGMTPSDAQLALEEILGNRQHPYWNPHMGQSHEAAKTRVLELTKLANPEASTDINDLRAAQVIQIG